MQKCDIYAIGIILYIFTFGKSPFNGDNIVDVYEMIQNNEPNYYNRDNEPVVDLIKRLIEKDPQKRISLEQTLLHEWLISTKVDTFDQNSKICNNMYNKISQTNNDGNNNNKKIITSLELGDSEDEAEEGVETGENKDNTLKTEGSHHDIVVSAITN